MPAALIALAVLVGVALGAVVALTLTRAVRRWRMARRFARGRWLEAEARAFLLRKGFQVASHGVSVPARLLVDGAPRAYEVRLDYVVLDLQGRSWVAEVKSGDVAPDPVQRATRRQLLEYAVLVPQAIGVLLVDMEARAVHEVAFPNLEALRRGTAAPSVEAA